MFTRSPLQAALNPFRGILLPTGVDANKFPRMYERLLMVRGISARDAKGGSFLIIALDSPR